MARHDCSSTFICDACGRKRSGFPTTCHRCGLDICERCWRTQAGKGHEEAEHGNEIRFEYGYDPNADVDGDDD